MHRLPRQVFQLRHISRVTRAQRPIISHRTPSLFLGRHYSEQNGPTARFNRILDSCGPHLTLNELAKKITALLVLSESNEALRTRVLAKLDPLVAIMGDKKAVLYRKLDQFMEERPEGRDDEFVETLEASSGHEDRYAQLPTYTGLEHPLDTVMNYLCTEEAKATIDSLNAQQQEDIYTLWNSVSKNPNDMKGFIEISELLEEHGMPITYQRRLPKDGKYSIQDELPPWIDEAKEIIRSHEAEIVEEDPEFAAQLAQEDAHFVKEPLQRRKSEPTATKEAPVANRATQEQPRKPDFEYPNLMSADPLLDSRDVLELPPDGKIQKFHNRVIIRNHTSIFHEAMAAQGFNFDDENYTPTKTDETEESASSAENLPLSPSELKDFYRFPLIRRRVTQQTGKGKIHRIYVLMVVGNGNGMVGLGQGKDEDSPRAEAKAFAQAVRNMDWVERFENRTIWTDMETKLGSTQILLRPRPVGFGLRCNPKLHQVLKAAGIKDISAKVWGSRNPINVIKAAFRVLQAGHAPLAMGDGFGGPGRKLNKGSGLRSKEELERERGRPLISLRK
ncbi:hypothetical protein H0H87_000799 [Tephrocybe sp. NHM501043]|nr:hypothetical protein H0H87_000799 [Tephrocybe sp. NHM501043]